MYKGDEGLRSKADFPCVIIINNRNVGSVTCMPPRKVISLPTIHNRKKVDYKFIRHDNAEPCCRCRMGGGYE